MVLCAVNLLRSTAEYTERRTEGSEPQAVSTLQKCHCLTHTQHTHFSCGADEQQSAGRKEGELTYLGQRLLKPKGLQERDRLSERHATHQAALDTVVQLQTDKTDVNNGIAAGAHGAAGGYEVTLGNLRDEFRGRPSAQAVL